MEVYTRVRWGEWLTEAAQAMEAFYIQTCVKVKPRLVSGVEGTRVYVGGEGSGFLAVHPPF